MLPDLNRLRVFFHVYATQGVGAAAAELHVTQSAVSQSLRKLEDELDAQLFVRARSGLVATQAAHGLFDVVSPFLSELARRVDHLHRVRSELVGTVRLGAPAEIGALRMPELLAAFRAEHPEARFELHLGHPFATIPMLERGELDLVLADVFAARTPQQVGLSVERLVDEQLVLVGSKRTVAKLDRTDTTAALLAGSYVAYRPRAPALHSWFAHHFRKTALPLDIALTVESVPAVIGAIEAHMGLGIVPSHRVSAQLRRGRLVQIATRRKPLTNRISLVRLLDRVPSALEKAVARYLREELRD
jgi:DNA-binding transcriptional LysR family regulator